MKKKQNVIIKGTKEGLTLHLSDLCSYNELKEELFEKLTLHPNGYGDDHHISVRIQSDNRFLTESQEQEIKDLVEKKSNLVVEGFTSNVITKKEAKRWKEEGEIASIAAIVRSGQILEVPGDLLLVGDVNPGGIVRANGNIFIMGALKGIAHAGYQGNTNAVIVASSMTPSQLRIAKYMNRAPDYYDKEGQREMECAYIDESEQIVIDRLQVLRQLRPNITRFKGGR